jgi:hypothetical protein
MTTTELEIDDLSDLTFVCGFELKRIGETWRSRRTKQYCKANTGYEDAHHLTRSQLEKLLTKLQSLPTANFSLREGARVKVYGVIGVVKTWDEDINAWIVSCDGKLEPYQTEELELVK